MDFGAAMKFPAAAESTTLLDLVDLITILNMVGLSIVLGAMAYSRLYLTYGTAAQPASSRVGAAADESISISLLLLVIASHVTGAVVIAACVLVLNTNTVNTLLALCLPPEVNPNHVKLLLGGGAYFKIAPHIIRNTYNPEFTTATFIDVHMLVTFAIMSFMVYIVLFHYTVAAIIYFTT